MMSIHAAVLTPFGRSKPQFLNSGSVSGSLGSIIAMNYAVTYQTQALVLIMPRQSTALVSKTWTGIEGLRDSTVFNNVTVTSSDLVRIAVRQMISSQDPNGYAATCEAIVAPSHIDPDYTAITCPLC